MVARENHVVDRVDNVVDFQWHDVVEPIGTQRLQLVDYVGLVESFDQRGGIVARRQELQARATTFKPLQELTTFYEASGKSRSKIVNVLVDQVVEPDHYAL